MERIDSLIDAAHEQMHAAADALDAIYREEAADEAHLIKARLVAGDADEITAIADEFQGAATTVPAIVAAWARKDTAEVQRLLDAALALAVKDVAEFRAEQLKP